MVGEVRQAREIVRVKRGIASDPEIYTGFSECRRDLDLPAGGEEAVEQGSQQCRQAGEFGAKHRALPDCRQVRATPRMEADDDPVLRAPGAETGSPTARRRHGPKGRDRHVLEADSGQRPDHPVAFPGPVGIPAPVLQHAAAAAYIVRAGRRLAVRRGRQSFEAMAAPSPAAGWLQANPVPFARKRAIDEDSHPFVDTDAVAPGPDLADLDFDFIHRRAGRGSGIRDCPRIRGWGSPSDPRPANRGAH